jgi:hypothetical protein
MIRLAPALASAAILALCLPAQAGKYTCTFSVNGKAPKAGSPCQIDTAAAAGQTCQVKFTEAGSAVATCGASQIDGNLDGLLCAFTTAAPKAADFLKDTIEPSIVNVVTSLHKKDGFAAGAVSIAGPTAANVSVGYAPKKGSQLAAICSPTAAP